LEGSHPRIISAKIGFKSSPLKPLNQIKPNLAGMVPGWVPFKIMSDSPALHSRWPLLQKIEISLFFYFELGGHLGWKSGSTDTILEGGHPRIISAKFG
jgi:hypothetical protein